MRSFDHLLRISCALALGLSLSACESLENLFDTKKPLPGERKPVFSDGVPGVPRGVPPELVRGYQAPAAPQQPTVVETPVEKPKPVGRPRTKPTTVAVPARPPATSITVQPNSPASPAPPASGWPAPSASGQSQQPAQQSTPQPAPWPAPSSAQGGAQAPSPWPTAPPPGTFSR